MPTVSALNLTAGQTVSLETSNLVGGTLKLQAASGGAHRLQLTDALTDAGIGVGATATAGAVGISRTAGTSMTLVGEVTSSNAKTDKVVFAIALPSTYVSGASFPVAVNCLAAGTGTLTAVSTTMTLAAYSELNGVETALSVSAAQQIPTTATTLTFTVTGTGLSSSVQILLEFVMLITTASGANTGTINAVSYTA